MYSNESVMRIVSEDWKGNMDWWSQIKIQGAGIWAVIMRPYMNICIHLFNLGEDVSHKYKHWRNIMETYTKGDISQLSFIRLLNRMNIKLGFPFEIVDGNGFVRI